MRVVGAKRFRPKGSRTHARAHARKYQNTPPTEQHSPSTDLAAHTRVLAHTLVRRAEGGAGRGRRCGSARAFVRTCYRDLTRTRESFPHPLYGRNPPHFAAAITALTHTPHTALRTPPPPPSSSSSSTLSATPHRRAHMPLASLALERACVQCGDCSCSHIFQYHCTLAALAGWSGWLVWPGLAWPGEYIYFIII